MPGLTGTPVALGGDIFTSSATQAHQLGTVGVTRDGRRFRYCKAGATLTVGDVIQAPAQITGHQNLTPTLTTYTGALGDTKVALTFGATACAANLYSEGWAVVDTTPGLGYQYPISAHAANTGTSLVVFTFASDSPIQGTAWTSSTRVTLVVNPYKNVIQCPTTTLTGIPVGVAVYPITSGEFGWIQTGGVGSVLIAGTPAIGNLVSVPSTGAGSVVINSGTLTVIGTMMVTGQAGLVQPVLLNINP